MEIIALQTIALRRIAITLVGKPLPNRSLKAMSPGRILVLKIFGESRYRGGVPGRDLPGKKMVLTKKCNLVSTGHR
jgi:hypothetical protein